MKRALGLCVFAAVSLFGQSAETIFFRAAMLPSNEIPAIDIAASGTATIRAHVVRDASGQVVSGTVDFIVNYTFPSGVELTGLHIHRGDSTVNGPVVINTGIGGAGGNINDPAGKGVISRPAQVTAGSGAALAALKDMLDNPAGFYVNMHTTVNPGGVIRGQLQKPEILTMMAIMSPANEVPAITGQNASAVAAVTAMRTFDAQGNMNTGLVMFEADYTFDKQVTMTGFHIHSGPKGVNAPVVINTGLANMPSTETGKGSLLFPVELSMTNKAQLDAMNGLFQDPSNYYVNIHTTDFPGGVIRSQLRRTDENVFSMNLSPANEVPPVDIQASAPANFKVNTIRDQSGAIIAGRAVFDVNYRFPGSATFTGLHIHDQVAGQNGPVIINTGISGANSVATDTGFGNIYIPVFVSSTAGLATLNSLMANPEKHYMNLHTTVNPGGVVRSQVQAAYTKAPAIGEALSSVIDQGQRNVAPGGLLSIFGILFAYADTDYFAWEGQALPTALNGVGVTVDGINAPLLMVSPGQIDVQVPYEVSPGMRQVVVKNSVGESNAFMVMVQQAAPAIWRMGIDGGQIVRVSDVTFISPDNPAQAGDTLAVFTTGMGQTSPALKTGAVVPEALFNTAAATVTIGGRPGLVPLSVAYPGVPGTYVVAVIVPPGVPSGPQPLQITMAGSRSNTVMLPIK
ncbi:MAG: CHRD domain-containing protein [Bryobacterales bacterium]|nr:CHRD domain-containing protein [Bryobacterales bacterium]